MDMERLTKLLLAVARLAAALADLIRALKM